MASTLVQMTMAGLASAAVVGGFLVATEPGSPTAALLADCRIKGNISQDGGDRIHHLPGQEFYDVTKIDPTYGERWFCTEAEARAPSWRKSKR